jgi:hypothetical protein
VAGVKGRSGRPPGSRRWNPTALAGHHLQVLIELWLAGAPIKATEIWMADAPIKLADRYLAPPAKSRHTVPPRIKRALAEMAIRHVQDVIAEAAPYIDVEQVLPPYIDVEQVLLWVRRRAPANTLRRKRGCPHI